MRIRKGQKAGGFSLVDVIFALTIVTIAILGVISLMMALRARNDAQSTSRHATQACQEVMEHVLADIRANTPGWFGKWNNKVFQPKKVVSVDKEKPPGYVEKPFNQGADEESNVYNCGRVLISDISDPAKPKTLYEISVSIDTTGLTQPPIKSRLVTRRSPLK